MSYSEIYTRINWQNDPDTSTPLDADNLNAMDSALKTIDTRVVTIGNDAMYASDVANCLMGQPTIDQTTGIISFPKKGGGAYTLDTYLEKVVTNWTFDPTTESLVLTTPEGSVSVSLSAFITETEFDDSSTIDFTVANHHVTAVVKAHSIGEDQLVASYRSDCENARDDAEDARDAAGDFSEDSEAWAVGQRGGTDVPSTDPTHHNNSKYYSEQSNSLGQAQAQNAEAWANGTRNGQPVGSSDPAWHNNAQYWKDQAAAIASNTFEGLTDVNFDNLQNGQVPSYNAATQMWENTEPAGSIFEKDITTRKLNVTPDMELSNITSNETVWLYDNENLCAIADIAETTTQGITYRVNNGLIYLNGTASGTLHIPITLQIPDCVTTCNIISTLEIVSGTKASNNAFVKTPCRYVNSGGTTTQWSMSTSGSGSWRYTQCLDLTATPELQISTGMVCDQLVLRPYLAIRTVAIKASSATNRPVAKRRAITGSLQNATGILMTMSGDFSAHIRNKKEMSVLFGKRMVLCGDSIAFGHSGDSFGYTIAENENMSLDKPATGGAEFNSGSEVTSITTQVCSLTKGYDYILVEGGINDALRSGVSIIGTLTDGFNAASYDESTFLGAVEKACRYLVDHYAGAKKLFILCHKCTNKNYVPYPVQDTFFDAMITALKKWNMPYIDIRKYPMCAYNSAFATAYFGTDFSTSGGLHPNNAGYALGYIDQITNALKTDFSEKEKDISGKADKVASATANNLAGLDANGNPTDSGIASGTVVTQSSNVLSAKAVANATSVATLGDRQIRNIYAGTTDLTPGVSALPTGDIYIVYEP